MGAGNRLAVAVAVAAALVLAVPAGAQEQSDPGEDGISAYSVGRLKIFEGTAWVRTPDSGEWEEFSHNSPVPERARVSIPEGSEAEIQFHGGQFMLLTGGSEIDVRRLSEESSVFRLRAGQVRFALPREDFAPLRVLVPDGGAVEIGTPGKYWLDAGEGGETRLVVRSGAAAVVTDRGRHEVGEGEEAIIGREVRVGRYQGEPDQAYEEPAPLSETEGEAGVPPAVAYELRDYGEWVVSPTYGYVWRPRVAVGWAPYYYGRWVWISPYGWTWIADEPWGWYPYHYGYWYTDPVFGWCWYPYRSFVSVSFVFGGARFTHFHGRAVFAPATVRFVGTGQQVRWVPLRPGERHASRVAFTRSDARLTHWEKRIPDKTVFVRSRADGGKVWRDWTERSPAGRGRTISAGPPSRPGPGAPAVRGGEVRGRGGTTVAPVERPAWRGSGGGGGDVRGQGRGRRSEGVRQEEVRPRAAMEAPPRGERSDRRGKAADVKRSSPGALGAGSFDGGEPPARVGAPPGRARLPESGPARSPALRERGATGPPAPRVRPASRDRSPRMREEAPDRGRETSTRIERSYQGAGGKGTFNRIESPARVSAPASRARSGGAVRAGAPAMREGIPAGPPPAEFRGAPRGQAPREARTVREPIAGGSDGKGGAAGPAVRGGNDFRAGGDRAPGRAIGNRGGPRTGERR